MTDETRENAGLDDATNAGTPGTVSTADDRPAPPRRRRRKWPWVLLGVFVLLPALIIVAWVEIALHWSYSTGTRTGYVQKFSKKGWLCKTWEGEIAMVNIPGAAQERFEFTVRSDSIAQLITRDQGQRVVIEYEQHKGLPTSCFGDTQYFVTGVRALGP
jgi:hypothetical protein